MKFSHTLIILALLTFIRSQPQTLELESLVNVELPPNQAREFQLSISSQAKQHEQLFIQAYAQLNDPSQLPKMSVTLGQKILECQAEASYINRVCEIASSELSSLTTLLITLECKYGCSVNLEAYLSDTKAINVGQPKFLKTANIPMQFLYKFKFPPNLSSGELRICLQQIDEPAFMYITKGQNPQVPSIDFHSEDELYSWPLLKCYILQTKQEETIKILVMLKKRSSAQLMVTIRNQGIENLNVNSPLVDNVGAGQERTYILEKPKINWDEDIQPELFITIFSGNPRMMLSLDQAFTEFQEIPIGNDSLLAYSVSNNLFSRNQTNLYLKVTSPTQSNFKIVFKFISHPSFQTLLLDRTSYLSLSPPINNIAIFNLKFSVDSDDLYTGLTVRTDSFDTNSIQFKAYLCLEVQSEPCIFENIDDLNDPTRFKLMHMNKMTKNMGQIWFAKTLCQKSELPDTQIKQTYVCNILFIGSPKVLEQPSKASILVFSANQKQRLHEQSTLFITLYKNTYKILIYEMNEDLQSIDKLIFYMNPISGTPVMHLFINETFEQKSTNYIILSKQEGNLKSLVYTLNITSDQYSEFTITAILNRNRSSDQSQTVTNSIPIQEGIAMKYQLSDNVSQVSFKYIPTTHKKVDIKVSELVGRVEAYIKVNDERIICETGECQVIAREGVPIFVQISKKTNYSQIFTILIKEKDTCYSFPIGVPLFSILNETQQDCLVYRINKNIPFEFSTSVTPSQALNSPISIKIYVGNSQQETEILGGSIIIDEQMLARCPEQFCPIVIKLKNTGQKIASLQLMGQYIQKVIKLYDGVAQRITNAPLSIIEGKYFTFNLNRHDDLQVYLTSHNDASYLICLQLVDQLQLRKTEDSFESYIPTKNSATWIIRSNKDHSRIIKEVIQKATIQQQIDSKNIMRPIFYVSIFVNSQNSVTSTFTIELTQKQRVLRVGQTLTGYLVRDQVVTYQIYSSQEKSALDTISFIVNEQGRECLTILTPLNNLTESSRDPIYVELTNANTQICVYELSLQSEKRGIKEIIEGFTQKVDLGEDYAQFLYYHNRNTSFKIIQLLEAGQSELLVIRLKNIQPSLLSTEISSIQYSDFAYQRQNNRFLEILPSDQNYCFNCYYLIRFNSSVYVRTAFTIVPSDVSVQLRDHAIVDDLLQTNQSDTFVYYTGSSNDFYILIGVVSGDCQVVIERVTGVNQSSKLVEKQISEGSSSFQISHSEVEAIALLKYRITLTAKRQTFYHIQINKQKSYVHLVEGIPVTIDYREHESISYGFDHPLANSKIKLHFSFQLDFKHEYAIQWKQNTISQYKNISGEIVKSGPVEIIQMKGNKGFYRVKLIKQEKFQSKVVALLPRLSITQLVPNYPLIFDTSNIFQIYIPPKHRAYIQVYDCSGTMIVRANQLYKQLEYPYLKQSDFTYIHDNFGGHVAFEMADVFEVGVTYVRVNAAFVYKNQQKQVEYQISYFLLPEAVPSPFTSLRTPKMVIEYEIGEKGQFNFSTTQLKEMGHLKVKNIEYNLIGGKREIQVRSGWMCDNKQVRVIGNMSFSGEESRKSKEVTIEVEKSQMKEIINEKMFYANILAEIESQATLGDQLITIPTIFFFYQNVKFTPGSKFHTNTQQTSIQSILQKYPFIKLGVIILSGLGTLFVIYLIAFFIKKCQIQRQNSNELVQEKQNQNASELEGSNEVFSNVQATEIRNQGQAQPE